MKGPLNIYYDEGADFLEITISNPPRDSYCEDINDDVFVRRAEADGEAIGIGIMNFKQHINELKNIFENVPLRISFESSPVSQ